MATAVHTRPLGSTRPVAPWFVLVVGAALCGAYLVALAWAMQHASYDTWGALIVAPALVALTVPMALRVARLDADQRLVGLIVGAVVVKLLGSLLRYYVTFFVYRTADANNYHETGVALARSFRNGDFDLGTTPLSGTRFVEILTGAVYTVIGPCRVGGFLVFAWFGFLGILLFTRALRTALPDADHRRYAILAFFLPSLLYWPSSVGKEAWVLLMLGLVALGVARLLAARPGRLLPLVAGIGGLGVVRPHIALIVVVALFAAYLFRSNSKSTPSAPLLKVLGVIVLAAGGVLVLTWAQEFFKVDELSPSSLSQVLDDVESQTSQDGSSFSPPRVRTPIDLPMATLTVLFRPLPFEAHNPQAAAAALEGMLLIGLFALGVPRWWGVLRRLRRSPYATFALVYTVGFIIAFSTIGNFGILARQRVQVLPVVLVFLALPLPRRSPKPSERPAKRCETDDVAPGDRVAPNVTVTVGGVDPG